MAHAVGFAFPEGATMAMKAGRFDGSINFSMIHKVMWELISIPEIIVAPSGKAKPTAWAIVVVTVDYGSGREMTSKSNMESQQEKTILTIQLKEPR
jgi:hypothetical protein